MVRNDSQGGSNDNQGGSNDSQGAFAGLMVAGDNQMMHCDMLSLLETEGPVVREVLACLPHTLAIYAFGSQVNGTAGPQSDLDLAVLVAGYAEPVALWELAATVADIVACPIDLLDLRSASTVMQYQVITTGRRIWANALQAGLFECYVLSEKTALDTARAPLLADIQATGAIYAR